MQWNVTNTRTVQLDGQAVAANASLIVTPTQTTAYTLRVIFLDGTTRDVTTIVTVTGSPPLTGLQWDPRLTTLGVNVVSQPAASAWRLIEGKYQDETESGGTHHLYYKLLNANGTPAAGVKIVLADQPSDTVRGMGLPAARHVNFRLTFRFQ